MKQYHINHYTTTPFITKSSISIGPAGGGGGGGDVERKGEAKVSMHMS